MKFYLSCFNCVVLKSNKCKNVQFKFMMYCILAIEQILYMSTFPLYSMLMVDNLYMGILYTICLILRHILSCVICCNEFHSNDNNYDWSKQMNGLIRCREKYVYIIYIYIILLLSFQLKCSSNIDSIHYLRLTNSFHQVPRDIHTLPVKEPIPSI